MPRICPSIASAKQLEIANVLKKLNGEVSLHLDIEDGNFTPNITFGMKMVQEIAQTVSMPLNAHLMVTNPLDYIKPLADLGVSEIAFHLESSPYPFRVLQEIHRCGSKAGIALNLSTPVSRVSPLLEEMEFLLLMTAEEDGQGQRFRQASLPRLQEAKTLLDDRGSLWADGGIGEEQLPLVIEAGADTLVIGRAVMLAEHPLERIHTFSKG